MAAHNYIPSGTLIRCDKGSIPAAILTAVNPTSTILGKQWATSADKVEQLSFQTFGNCACKAGLPCKPSVKSSKWKKTAGPDILCNGNELLIDESILPCMSGGIISIVPTPPPADAPSAPSGALSN